MFKSVTWAAIKVQILFLLIETRTIVFANGLLRNIYAVIYSHEGMIVVWLETLKKLLAMLLGTQ